MLSTVQKFLSHFLPRVLMQLESHLSRKAPMYAHRLQRLPKKKDLQFSDGAIFQLIHPHSDRPRSRSCLVLNNSSLLASRMNQESFSIALLLHYESVPNMHWIFISHHSHLKQLSTRECSQQVNWKSSSQISAIHESSHR